MILYLSFTKESLVHMVMCVAV